MAALKHEMDANLARFHAVMHVVSGQDLPPHITLPKEAYDLLFMDMHCLLRRDGESVALMAVLSPEILALGGIETLFFLSFFSFFF